MRTRPLLRMLAALAFATPFVGAGCVGPDEPPTPPREMNAAAAVALVADAWSPGAQLVAAFGVRAAGLAQLQVTPPWGGQAASFALPTLDSSGRAWAYAYADPQRPGVVFVVASTPTDPVGHEVPTDARLLPLGVWNIDGDEALACAALEDPEFRRPLDLSRESFVYALYRPAESLPATWFLSRVTNAGASTEGDVFVARSHVVDAMRADVAASAQNGPMPAA